MAASSLKETRIRDLIAQQRLEEARTLCERTLATTPGDAGVWLLGAVVHGMLDQPEQTERYAREAIRLRPAYAEAYNSLGLALRLQGRPAEAVPVLQEAMRLKPDYADACYNLGLVFGELGQLTEAVAAYERSHALRPRDPEALNNLGNALQSLRRHAEAADCYRRALALSPAFALAHFNLGNALVDLGKTTEAVVHYRKAVEIDATFTEAHYNLGDALRISGQLQEAIPCYRAAIHRKPDHAQAHFNLSSVYLLLGQFDAGWNEYVWHWQRHTSPARPFAPTPWNGSGLGGRNVFLHAEQGLGDELFFLRFVPRLKQRGAGRVVYRPSRKIAPLLARLSVIDGVAAAEEMPAPEDRVLSVGDLPRLLGMARAEEIPPSLALAPLPSRVESVRQQLAGFGPPPYVGVTWRAGTPDKEDLLNKETPLARLARTLQPLKVTVLVLQRAPVPGEIDAFCQNLGRKALDLSALNDDLESMLALLALLDDYVGVSNTNMHLRAAVGKTARVLVPAPPEWRWMAEGKESPWFPGFSVYRQGYDGSWEGAFDMLAADLQQAFGR